MNIKKIQSIVIATFAAVLFIPSASAMTSQEMFEDFNTWLITDNYGVDLINTQLKATKAQAHQEWDDRAALYEFEVTSDGSVQELHFRLSSYNVDDADYYGHCCTQENQEEGESGLETSIVENNPEVKDHIYRLDILLRDLIPEILNSERTMSILSDVLPADADLFMSISLAKNSENALFWTVELTDQNTQDTYLLKRRADRKEDHIVIFHKLK